MVADHFDASAELRSGVVGGGGFAALGFEISDAVGAVRETQHQVGGAGDVAAEAVGHHLGTDNGDAIPEFIGEQGLDPSAVVTMGRWREVGRRVGVEPLMCHHLQSLVDGVAPWLPDVAAGHDCLHLLGCLGHG